MIKELSQKKKDKYDKIKSVDSNIKAGKLTNKEKVELKSHKIKEAIKNKLYVRN